MSIQILKNGDDVTNDIYKLSRVYTNGFIAQSGDDIVENYSIVYTPESETNITVTFPPKQGTNDTFEILFETPTGDSLNNQTIQLTDFTNNSFDFKVRIAKSVADTLNGTVKENIFNRSIIVTGEFASYIVGLRFALDKTKLSFETLDVSKVEVAVKMFLDDTDGNSQLVPVSSILEADRAQLYRVEYKPSYANQVQRTSPLLKGFSDTNRPNSFTIEFTRTSTTGDVDDNYDIIFNKSGYLDGLGNELLETKQLLNIVSAQIVVQALEYITRMTQYGREILNVSWDAPDGLIDISDISVLLYEFNSDTMTQGAQIRPEDIKEYYITIGGSGVDLNGITMNGKTPLPQSLTGTKRFGPFLPQETVQIFGTMQDSSNTGALRLTHYAYLNDTAEDGTPIASQMDTQETVFNITRRSSNADSYVMVIPTTTTTTTEGPI